MTTRRVAPALLSTLAALTLAACATTTNGQGTTGDGTGSTGSGGNGPAAAIGPGVTPTQLADAMTSALAHVTSAHIAVDVSLAGQAITGVGDEKLSNGKLQAFRLTENLPGGVGTFAIVVVGTKVYVKVPASMNTSGKPWLLASPSSSNPVARQLSQTLGSTLSSASVANANTFARAASKVSYLGKATVAGTQTTHVKAVVDPTKVSAALPDLDKLRAAGVTSVPVDIYLDAQNRPVETDTTVTVSGQTVTSKATVSAYNQPVTISAPPASQVAS